mmetsp:Transcript_13742/g.42780  ORF Transcript_13742/g.42780 Transcript_13742/m.42780 type:complete len:215 (-) Transcript_13742:18-662(-)
MWRINPTSSTTSALSACNCSCSSSASARIPRACMNRYACCFACSICRAIAWHSCSLLCTPLLSVYRTRMRRAAWPSSRWSYSVLSAQCRCVTSSSRCVSLVEICSRCLSSELLHLPDSDTWRVRASIWRMRVVARVATVSASRMPASYASLAFLRPVESTSSRSAASAPADASSAAMSASIGRTSDARPSSCGASSFTFAPFLNMCHTAFGNRQ